MPLGIILFIAGIFVARLAPRPGRWLKIAGITLFLGVPALQIAYGIYLGELEARALAGN